MAPAEVLNSEGIARAVAALPAALFVGDVSGPLDAEASTLAEKLDPKLEEIKVGSYYDKRRGTSCQAEMLSTGGNTYAATTWCSFACASMYGVFLEGGNSSCPGGPGLGGLLYDSLAVMGKMENRKIQ